MSTILEALDIASLTGSRPSALLYLEMSLKIASTQYEARTRSRAFVLRLPATSEVIDVQAT
jgi:hypothetical protein